MEKVGVLIARLLEQYRSKSPSEQLRITTQLLLSELQKDDEEQQSLHSVVSVFFPAASHYKAVNGNEEIAVLPELEKETGSAYVEPGAGLKTNADKQIFEFFDPMLEIPTLALKQQELNETIA